MRGQRWPIIVNRQLICQSSARSRRYTIGLHGVWTLETARREAKALLGQVAHGGDPAEEREEDRKSLTVKQLCEQYISDMEARLILGKGGRPKKDTPIATDVDRNRPASRGRLA